MNGRISSLRDCSTAVMRFHRNSSWRHISIQGKVNTIHSLCLKAHSHTPICKDIKKSTSSSGDWEQHGEEQTDDDHIERGVTVVGSQCMMPSLKTKEVDHLLFYWLFMPWRPCIPKTNTLFCKFTPIDSGLGHSGIRVSIPNQCMAVNSF